MARTATEAVTRDTNEWIASHVRAANGRRYRPPKWRGLRRKLLRRMRKFLTGHYYQLLSGHATIGTYLHDRIQRTDTSECWWCSSGELQSRHLFTRCQAWAPQIRSQNIFCYTSSGAFTAYHPESPAQAGHVEPPSTEMHTYLPIYPYVAALVYELIYMGRAALRPTSSIFG